MGREATRRCTGTLDASCRRSNRRVVKRRNRGTNAATAELDARLGALIQRETRPVRTITADNGTEFHSHKTVEQQLPVRFCFAAPHHSWERGSNENTNGLIRQYIPKGVSMDALTQADCDRIAAKLNRRPRRRYDWHTPEELYAA